MINVRETKLLNAIERIRLWSDNLEDEEIYLDKKWVEIDLTDMDTQSIIHIFNDKDSYLHSLNGNITKGYWYKVDSKKSIIIESVIPNGSTTTNSIYDLLFLNNSFLILKKNGKNLPFFEKFLFLIKDQWEEPLSFNEAIDELQSIQKNNYSVIVISIILILGLIAWLFYK